MELLWTAGTIVIDSPSADSVPPGFIAVTRCRPFCWSQTASSYGATTCAPVARARPTASAV